MSAPYLHHVTLQTGHTRRSPRSEVADGVVAQLRPLLELALTGEHAPLWTPGYTITGTRHGPCATVTLWAQHTEGGPPEPVPVVTIGIAGHSRCGAHLWRALHERGDGAYATDPERVPPEPWVADRLEAGMALHPDAAEWTGDYSRCVGWTFLEAP